MTKGALVFNWQKREGHPGHKIFAFLLVLVIFTGLFGIIGVRIKPLGKPVLETAAVLQFGDDGLGRLWRLRAEEEGPFPGKLEIDPGGDAFGASGFGGLADASGFDGYEVGLMDFDVDEGGVATISPIGKRYFPVRRGPLETKEAVGKAVVKAVQRLPILTSYSTGAQKWVPEVLPEFDLAINDETASASWRFIMNLREDGSVEDCVAISGGEDDGLKGMCGWLSGVKFKEGKGERWFGLRVEFINR